MSGRVRWGIVGTGDIATAYVNAVRGSADGELVAVASRRQDTADVFATTHSIDTAHGSYEALAADPAVDVVYVATPHHRHRDDCLLYLEAGKHVACEKPLGLNEIQVAEMADVARRDDRFFVEAIWSRFLPSYRTLVELLDEGRIGTPLQVEASFGARLELDPEHRLRDPHQAGGSLLDMGIYPVQLAHLVLGEPAAVTALAHMDETGVDDDTVVSMRFEGGGLAVGRSAIRTKLPCTAQIVGTEGIIDVPAFMVCPLHLDVETSAGRERIETPPLPAPWTHVVDEVNRCVRSGEIETPLLPLAESRAIARTLDRARAAIGLRYPSEQGEL